MKVIFLDIDGVLNHKVHYDTRLKEYDQYPYSEFDDVSVSFLNCIIEQTNAKIVLTSSWRFDGIEYLNKLFERVGIESSIYDVTVSLHKEYGVSSRGKEIDEWLVNHKNIENYVILDDETDIEEYQLSHFVKTNAYGDGLNKECADKAVHILNFDKNVLY